MANRRRRRTRQGRRGAPGCLSVLFLTVCVVAALLAAIFIFFKTRNIEVVGAEHYTPEQVVAASGAEVGQNLVFLSKSSMTHGIFAELPYVSEVRISRSLPDTLVISVVETSAAAYAESGGVYWLLDSGGKILERATAAPSGLVELRGAPLLMPAVGETVEFSEESELRLRTYSETMRALERAELLGRTESLDLAGLYDVTIELDGRFTAKLGAPEELDYKLEFLCEIMDNKLRPNQRGTIDLSNLIEKGEARFLEEY